MEVTGVGMMMEAATVGWEAQVLGRYRSTNDEHCGYAALEPPIADPTRPIATLAGPNALLEGLGSPTIQKLCSGKGIRRDELESPTVGVGAGGLGMVAEDLRVTLTPKLDWSFQLVDGMSLAKDNIFLFRMSMRRYFYH
ncbi:unnamed protein product [Lactuca saligna]|uniref:Uncharacterized protein n=1 Tax=Lactuca saligna TaxID=75948 RepID=A0AA35Y393_LACSI|nr:unnamed protein product [Lactuca saligna]